MEKLNEINKNVVISDVIKDRMEKPIINNENTIIESEDEDDMIDNIEVPRKRLDNINKTNKEIKLKLRQKFYVNLVKKRNSSSSINLT